ncbi:MAG TPA: deoxyribonuclease IV [Candidatus Anaerostipes excrementavium]|uniref:Probable endonuclease 4 n=1 Tax=Candidatus Anaerostipes excrementavium TaxID=2838463 RepID=A0A9D2B8Y6_9FIRM|nr:deoxyribonuclease IV [uncultured Anaerostipes sp.]HIX66584.1 deoxyribonuclease IV [Candidatus Anaerostipes excrementavium]
MLIGSHVGMKGKDMFLGSVKEALSYGANTFMVYTGAPQNTRRKKIEELRIEEGQQLMKEEGIDCFIVHAPYIINLANTVKKETFELAADFLKVEIERTAAMGSDTLVLHPGSHVGAGSEAGIAQIIRGLNQVLTADTPVNIALETMAGKGSEVGRTFEELKQIYEGVDHPEKLRVCFDTCHVNDSGLDVKDAFDEIIESFDQVIGKDQIAVFHINDSKNPMGAAKDRHENLGFGAIGFEALNYIVHHKDFENIPKILETPYIKEPDGKKSYPPYRYEIEMLRQERFDEKMKEKILEEMTGAK